MLEKLISQHMLAKNLLESFNSKEPEKMNTKNRNISGFKKPNERSFQSTR